MDPTHAQAPHAVEAVEQGQEGVAVQAGAAVSPRSLWLCSPDCLLQVLCCVAFCGHPAQNFASLNRAFRGDEVLWGCIKDRRGRDGKTCLMACCLTGDLARVRWLLDRGADVNAARDGITSLMAACHEGHLEIARVLLGRGVNINAAETSIGWTSLLWACQNGHLEVVRELLGRDAHVNAALTSDDLSYGCMPEYALGCCA
jgi:hypothetical protein